MRICKICGKEKPESEFFKYKDGHQRYVCKECSGKKAKDSRAVLKENDPEFLRERDYSYKETYKNTNPIKYWCSVTRDNHKRKGFVVKFTTDELYEKIKNITTCKYCGSKLIFGSSEEKTLCNRPTLDRINNEKIMTLNNVQVICNCCNAGKAQMTHQEFIEHCKNIASRWS